LKNIFTKADNFVKLGNFDSSLFFLQPSDKGTKNLRSQVRPVHLTVKIINNQSYQRTITPNVKWYTDLTDI